MGGRPKINKVGIRRRGKEGFSSPVRITPMLPKRQLLEGYRVGVSSHSRCLTHSRCLVNIRKYMNDRNEVLRELRQHFSLWFCLLSGSGDWL